MGLGVVSPPKNLPAIPEQVLDMAEPSSSVTHSGKVGLPKACVPLVIKSVLVKPV